MSNKVHDYACACADIQTLYGQVLVKHSDKGFEFLIDELAKLTQGLTKDRGKCFDNFDVKTATTKEVE